MRILFLCKTPYQIMIAARLKYVYYGKENADIVLFDTIANCDILQPKLRNGKLFDQAYIYRCRERYGGRLRRLHSNIFPLPEFPAKGTYENIFFANVYDWIENRVIRNFRKSHPETKIFMFEDGFASYSSHYGDFFQMIKKFSPVNRMLYSEYADISGMFVFSPKLLIWNPPCEVRSIPKIRGDEAEFCRILNGIFAYENMKDTYEQKYIFFEESYYADGIKIGDLALVDHLAELVGKENILVKIHPRNLVNRFKERGYATNINTEIPWEVIALNLNLEEKVLITIASGSALTSLINMESEPQKIIMLMKCDEVDYDSLTPTRDLLLYIAKMRNECVALPKNMEETAKLLREESMAAMPRNA